MPEYLLLKHYRGGPGPDRPFPPMDQRAPEAAQRAANVAEGDHLTRQAARARSSLTQQKGKS